MCQRYRMANKVKQVSYYLLVFSFLATAACLLISYPYAELFSIPIQVAAHILTIVFAGSFKIAVVALMAVTSELKTITANTNSASNLCCPTK
ncbi:hypothetical protein [Thalassotalea atypica]|uniref:hypothetical protein n=1 Tax=Thalassotalea atypica TaxID=2054316 RepID=UPI002572C8DB|nr:hypothetical protein [Thalassotalea atypica]